MERVNQSEPETTRAIPRGIGRTLGIDAESIHAYGDFATLIENILRWTRRQRGRLLVAGLATPDVQIAADRVDWQCVEVLGESPFAGSVEPLLDGISADNQILFLANPNPISGAGYGLGDISEIAARVGDGLLIVDERLYEYQGISAVDLLGSFSNLLILRSMTPSLAWRSDDSGLLIGTPELLADLRGQLEATISTDGRHRMLSTDLWDGDGIAMRVAEVRREARRLAQVCVELGVQYRCLATDFVLLRVADPARFGNHLAAFDVQIDNLDGYPQMQGYVRYRIVKPRTTDRLIRALKRMPSEYYRMSEIDRRPVIIRRPGESSIILGGRRPDPTAGRTTRRLEATTANKPV